MFVVFGQNSRASAASSAQQTEESTGILMGNSPFVHRDGAEVLWRQTIVAERVEDQLFTFLFIL